MSFAHQIPTHFSRKAATALVLSAALITSTACVTNEQMGQIGGGILGGLAGGMIGGNTASRILLASGGAILGAWLGGQFAKYLDEQDQQTAGQAFTDTAATGESITWSNPDTGVSGTTRVVKSDMRSETTQVSVLKDRIDTVPPLDFLGENRTAKSGTNVRGGPGTDYRVVGSLNAGDTVEVVGKVQGTNWLMVAENGAGAGFVREDLLAQGRQAQTAELDSRAASLEQKTQAGEVETVAVRAERECRLVEQEILLSDGKKEIESITACRGPNGWEVV